MSDEELTELLRWCECLKDTTHPLYAYDAASTRQAILARVPELIAEIRRLRAERPAGGGPGGG